MSFLLLTLLVTIMVTLELNILPTRLYITYGSYLLGNEYIVGEAHRYCSDALLFAQHRAETKQETHCQPLHCEPLHT